MVLAERANIIKEKELPIIDERCLIDTTAIRPLNRRRYHSIRFDKDSYVLVFSGRRGGGKTTTMTFMALQIVAKYHKRLISNYPIECYIRRFKEDGMTYLEHVKSEELDFEKLMIGGEEYRDCLVVIDEAPDVISHMASQTWKNRLVAAFTRQIRKLNISLMLAAQDFDLIDKSMRWQVDIRIDCKDAARMIGDDSPFHPGKKIWLHFYDDSGQWTSRTTETRQRNGERSCVLNIYIKPGILFGDEDHKAVFDSWAIIDILDSLRRVDLKLSKITITDSEQADIPEHPADRYPVSVKILTTFLLRAEQVIQENTSEPYVYQVQFNASLGPMTNRDKNNMGKVASLFGIENGRDNSNGKRFYGFGSFDFDGLREYIQIREGRGE